MEKGLEKKDTAFIQVTEGSKVRQEIIPARLLTPEEADREIASICKTNLYNYHSKATDVGRKV